MLPTMEVPAPIEQTVSGRAGALGEGAGSAGRGGGGAAVTAGLAGAGGGGAAGAGSGLPLKLLSMGTPSLRVGIPAFRHDRNHASSPRGRAFVRIRLWLCPQPDEA